MKGLGLTRPIIEFLTCFQCSLENQYQKFSSKFCNFSLSCFILFLAVKPPMKAHKDRIYNINVDQRPARSNRRDKNDAVIYQDKMSQSFMNSFSVKQNSTRFILYSNSSINTAKIFKSTSIYGYSGCLLLCLQKQLVLIGIFYITDIVRVKTYRINEIFKCKIPTSYTRRWLLIKITNISLYLEKLLKERKSIKKNYAKKMQLLKMVAIMYPIGF